MIPYKILENNILEIIFPERIDLPFLNQLLTEVQPIEVERQIKKRLMILTNSIALDLSYPDLNTIKLRRTARDPIGKTAYVYGNSLTLGYCRMWQEINDLKNLEIELFIDKKSAINWLNQ